MTSLNMDKDEEIKEKGLHNWRKLFRKPNMLEWTILIMLIMVFFMAWAYQRDIKVCKEFLRDIEINSCSICQQFADKVMNTINETDKLLINEDGLKGIKIGIS